MNTATNQNSTTTPTLDVACPVLHLAREYDRLAIRMNGDEDDPDADAIFERMYAISDEASYLRPATKLSAAFDLMLISKEVDLAFGGGDTPSQRAASRAKINRLLYRLTDFMLANGELPNVREYLMRADLDPQAPYSPKAA